MTTLTEFLLARIAEDEAVAQKAGGDEWEYAAYCGAMQIQTVRVDGTLGYEQHLAITRDYEGLSDSVGEDAGPHIARHDPARVLAECEAKQRIVANHLRHSPGQSGYGASRYAAACLAMTYDHPDYQAEWMP